MHQRQLTAKVLVLRLRCQRLSQRLGNLAPQLGGGGVGKGDDQKFVDILPFLTDLADHAIHQHLGFAGACGSGNQQRAATVLNYCLLL